jgi:hypothetical protein
VNSVLNLRVPWSAGKLSSGLSGSAQLHIVSLEPQGVQLAALPQGRNLYRTTQTEIRTHGPTFRGFTRVQ